jgi:raffinose synthase
MRRFLFAGLVLLALPAFAQVSVEEQTGDTIVKVGSQSALVWQSPVANLPDGSTAAGKLELQRPAPHVVVGLMTYAGAPPRAEDSVSLQLQLPEFARGLSIYRLKRFWTSPVFTSDPRNLAGDSQLLIWQQRDGDGYHVLAPLLGDGLVAGLGVRNHRFGVQASSYVPGHLPRRIPLFVYAHGADPYQTLRDAYSAALPLTGASGKLRWQKPYPAQLKKLGWCSWNAFYEKVDREKILQVAAWLRQHKVPTAYVLVDDGWMTVEGRKLAGFGAEPRKFPGGLPGLVRDLKGRGFEHVGVWHTLQGYWDGVVPQSPAGTGQTLFAGNEGLSIPHPGGTRFFFDWYRNLKTAGIEFVKVDNQGGNFRFTDGKLPRADANRGMQEQLQQAVAQHFGNGLINCMELSLENVYNWSVSNVARSSDDFLPDNRTNSSEHLLHNAYSTVWLANFAYPDYDMFESGAPDGEFHAVARALSGGPVYCTDTPAKGNPRVLKALCLASGEVLRPDEPARVPQDMLLRDPSLESIPLRLQGQVRRGDYHAVLVGSFHVNKSADVVSGSEWPAGVRAQDGWVAHRHGAPAVLAPADKLELKPLGWQVTTFARIRDGVAVFGLLDKYAGAAAVVEQKAGRVRLAEGGRLGLWVKKPPRSVRAGGRELKYALRDHWMEVDVPGTELQLEF